MISMPYIFHLGTNSPIKDYGTSPTGFGDRTGSFGSNMVGVTAYGR